MMNFNFLRGPGNVSLDLMRIGGASAFVLYPFPFIWGVLKHGIIPDPVGFGTGYGLVIGAIGAAIGAKDICVSKASATAVNGGTASVVVNNG